MQKNKEKFMSVPEHVGRFAFKNLSKIYAKGWMGEYDEEGEDKLQAGAFEVTAMYVQVYENLSVRVLDMMNGGRLSPKQALDVLCSYAIAEEGTNTLYVGLVELLA